MAETMPTLRTRTIQCDLCARGCLVRYNRSRRGRGRAEAGYTTNRQGLDNVKLPVYSVYRYMPHKAENLTLLLLQDLALLVQEACL